MEKLLIIALLIVGCDNSTEPEVHPLVGVWKGLEFTRTFGELSQTIPFESNGVYITLVYYDDMTWFSEQIIQEQERELKNGTWNTSGNILTSIYGGGEETGMVEYAINGDILSFFGDITTASDTVWWTETRHQRQ